MREGFQKTFLNDVYHVEERLQEYDPTLYLLYNPKTNEHLVMDGLLEIAIMKVPQIGFETLDSRIVDHIKHIHTANGFNVIHEIEEREARKERDNEKRLEDLAYNLAKDLKKPLNEVFG